MTRAHTDTAARPDGAPPRWGLGDALLGWVIGVAAQTVAVGIYLAATHRSGSDALDTIPLTAVALLELPLWLGLLGVPLIAARVKGRGVAAEFGWRFRMADAPTGVAIGIVSQALLVPLLYWPIARLVHDLDVSTEARKLTDRVHSAPAVVALVLVTVVGAPIVEELFYRGLLLRALERRFGPGWALAGSSVAFGLAHLQLVQLPALVMFGLIAGYLAQRSGRLGPSTWAHVGFNAFTLFYLLVLTG